MLGRKKKKKSERQYSLDVRARSKPLQALRLRMATGALAISAGIVLVLFVAWKGGQFLMDEYVLTNPAFSIEMFSDVAISSSRPPTLMKLVATKKLPAMSAIRRLAGIAAS